MKFRKIEKSNKLLHDTAFYLYRLLKIVTLGLPLFITIPAIADNTVQLKVLVIATQDDIGLAFIKPHLDELAVPYDILDASTTSLTAATLSPNGCNAATAGCIGNYNGIIVTLSDLAGAFTPSEWGILHQYEKDFQVREAVISGWPGTYWDPSPPAGVYLDYGMTVTASGTFPNTQWLGSAGGPTIFEYLNTSNPLPVTEWAFASIPRNDNLVLRDGTVPSVEPLLATLNGEALVSIVRYYLPNQPTVPVREVLLSTITNAWFLVHSQALAYEFINFATQGVFVGGRYIYMSAHVDDIFLSNDQWDPTNTTDPNNTARLTDNDIVNGVSAQTSFLAAYTTVPNNFKLDFAFNGAGAVVNPTAPENNLVVNLADNMVAEIVTNMNAFRYINHTFTHSNMDNPPIPASAPCDDYVTQPTMAAVQAEITKNWKVWNLLGLPEKADNERALVTGSHSGLKNRKCTDIPELHPEMLNVQSDDIPYPQGANPIFFEGVANLGIDFIASDPSQLNQDVEHFISEVDDGSDQDRVMTPRYPTNIFYNVTEPTQLTDEYNYIFHESLVNNGQDPCAVPGAICTPRTYAQILAAESDTALRHMMTTKKWSHYFHQSNLVNYGNGNTLVFDWLIAAFDEYETLFNLPIKNLPFYHLGDMTKERLIAKSATIQGTWNRTTNKVTLSADKSVPNLLVTGVQGGGLYGGQIIREINIGTTPQLITVNQALSE